jgi:hypothetical protein
MNNFFYFFLAGLEIFCKSLLLWALIIGLVVGCIVSYFTLRKPSNSEINSLKLEAINLNHAEFNPKTGQWQWITNNYTK